MKTWFNGDSEGKIKRGSNNRKGTLSDELSKADHIGRQLRYNEAELNQMQDQKKPASKTAPNNKEEDELKSKRGPVQMSSPFPPRRKGPEEEVRARVEIPEPVQMSSPFPPRRQAVEEVTKTEAPKAVQMSAPFPPHKQAAAEPQPASFGAAPFPARIQPGAPSNGANDGNTPWKPQPLAAEHTIKYGSKETAQLPQESRDTAREVAKEIIKSAPKTMEVEVPSSFATSLFEEVRSEAQSVPQVSEVEERPQGFGLGAVTPLGEMKDYGYSDSYGEDYEDKYEEAYNEDYTEAYDESYDEYVSAFEEEDQEDNYTGLGFIGVEPTRVEETIADIAVAAVEEAAPTVEAVAPSVAEVKQVAQPTGSKPNISLRSNIVISFDKDNTMALNMNIGSVITILNGSGEQFDFKITNDGNGGQNLNVVAPAHTIYQILALFE